MDERPPEWQGRAVLHVDMDAFFASVEQLDHPEWRGRPVVVGGRPGERGVIAAASYEARRYGVRSAMPATTAARLLPPDAVWTHGNFERYGEMSAKVRAIFEAASPHVQMVSIDEGYLDATPGRTGDDPVAMARRIQAQVDELGVTCSVGVSASKVVAKIASDKDKPHGLTVVRPGEEAAFLAPLPAREMPGVGAKTEERLHRLGIRTIGDLAAMDEATAHAVLGSYGPELVNRARGIDPRPVVEGEPRKSVSREHTFTTDVRDRDEVEAALRSLAEQVGVRVRRKGLTGRTVTVKLRFADFTTKTARRTLPVPTDRVDEYWPVARSLLRSVWSPGIGLRLLGVGLSGFEEPAEQLDLFSAEERLETDDRRRRLTEGVDAVRRKFGDESLRMGGDEPLRRRPGTEGPKPASKDEDAE